MEQSGSNAARSRAKRVASGPRERVLIWRANYHPDGGQLFQPLGESGFIVPLALPGDDVTPEKFVSFWCDGSRGLYLHPNVWHGAVIPLDGGLDYVR